MGIFDIFRKNDPAQPKQEPRKEDASPSVPAAQQSPETAAPAPVPPAPAKADGAGNQPRSENKNQALPWPRFGSAAGYLLSAFRFRVFADASFIRCKGFPAFLRCWKEGKNEKNASRYFFIPSFEKSKLTAEETAALPAGEYREFYAKSPEDCFSQMKNKGGAWNIIWLTADAEAAAAVKAAAEGCGIELRWYGVTPDGKIAKVGHAAHDPAEASAPKAPLAQPLFPRASALAKISRAADPPAAVPAAGRTVAARESGKVYTLGAPVMTDHVSITYKTNDPAVFAKIYTVQALRMDLFENKTARMLRTPVRVEGVCWPLDQLADGNGRFVGILVPASRGVQLTKSVLAGRAGLQASFPAWDKRDLCTVTQTVISVICRLQALGVSFGCLNPASIYVENSTTVFFVDTDGLQIEGYPVMSQNLTFTLPERLDAPKTPHLFTEDEENYQVALLIFMMLMPGKFPYAKRGRSSEEDSIRNMSFPFSLGDMRRSQDAERPGGIWQIVWDHLPYNLCLQLYNSFTKNGTHAAPGTRLAAPGWLPILNGFCSALQKPENAESRALFPRTFRRDGKRQFVRCSICGQEHPDFYFLRRVRIQQESVDIWAKGYRICLPCAVDQSNDPGAGFTCKSCNRTFYYTNRTQVVHEIGRLDYDFKNQKWCNDCKKRKGVCQSCRKEFPQYQLREYTDRRRNLTSTVCQNCFSMRLEEEKRWKNEPYETRVCTQCSRRFVITNGEEEFFRSKGYNLPTRCPYCRKR